MFFSKERYKNFFIIGLYMVMWLPLASYAQQQDFYGNQAGDEACKNSTYTPDTQVTELVNRIVKVVGFESSYIIRPCPSVQGCLATVDHRGRPYILYEPAYLMRVKGLRFTTAEMPAVGDWRVLHVLAHEVAHHLRSHLTNPNPGKSAVELELEADETAGYLLYMLGAPNLTIARQALLGSDVSVEGSFSHPPQAQRLAAFGKGWQNALERFPRQDVAPAVETRQDVAPAVETVVEPPSPVVIPPPPTEPDAYTDALAGTMVLVTGGSFDMGCTSEQQGCLSDEKPAHSVKLDSYYIGKYELTQAQWRAVMGSNPSHFQGCDECPVENVSWHDIQTFLQRLNARTGQQYRLPTEAEWEFAARGGVKSRGYQFAGSHNLNDVGWYYGNSANKTQPVGRKLPNELGLYDMSGNVWEWCQDWYGDYSAAAQMAPKGASNGTLRIYRGGSWVIDPMLCRVAYRGHVAAGDRDAVVGFRLVRTP